MAGVLRFYKLGEYPALNADEAAIGYNAYSLILTGKDEHGNSWPIHFQSFNDYKPGLYFYLVLPLVKFLGLSEWAVRIPNAILGVLTVFLVYLFCKELFPKRKFGIWNLEVGIIASFMLAISPLHIHFSRGGWEVDVSTFFILLGVFLFLKGRKNLTVLMFSVLSFVFAMYSYHAARVIVPLLGVGMLVIYRDEMRKNFKNYTLATLVGLVAILPLVKELTKTEAISRAAGVGLFSDPGPVNRVNEQRGEHSYFDDIKVKILHNKPVNYGLTFLENWIEHYDGEFLFLSGDDIQRNKTPETGQLYLFQLPLLLTGFWFIFKKPGRWTFILWWLIVGPIASAFTFQSPHALRAHNMVIPLTIISAYGLLKTKDLILMIFKNRIIKYSVFSVMFLVIFWELTRYLHMYYVHMTKEYPFSSQYGVKELVDYLETTDRKFSKVVVTDRYDQPYILFLFYLKYPPQKFQDGHVLTERDRFGFSTVRQFDRYVFTSIQPWDKIRDDFRDSLIAGTNEEVPVANIVKKIYGSNGYLYFEVVAN